MSTAASADMKVERKDLNESTILLEIACSPDQVKAGFNKAIRQLGKKMKLPGFRPGQAPLAMMEKALPEYEIMNAAGEEIIRAAYMAAIKDAGIEPAGQPMVELGEFKRNELVCEFTVKVPLPPVVELGTYKGIEIKKPSTEVTDEEVDKQLDALRKQDGKQEKITDRGIQAGDMAVVNIKLDGQEGDGRSFMIIAGQTFPSLDKLISGMGVEEIKSADLEFPENFQEKDWAGTSHHAHVTIRSVSNVHVPELNDEFAANFNADSVDELKVRMKSAIERAKEQSVRDMANEQIMEAILGSSKVVVADTTWESVADRRLQEMAENFRREKKSLEDYAKEQGMSIEEMVAAVKQEAKLHVERAVLIEQIFKDEKLEVTEDDQNRHFVDILTENEITQDKVEGFVKEYGQSIYQEIILRARYGKVMDFLNDNANVVAVTADDATPKPAATKKPAAKKAKKAE
jgi:trigger factor